MSPQVLSAFFSLLPFGGTALVWVPVAAYLFWTASLWKAMVMIAVGVGLVGLTDNRLAGGFARSLSLLCLRRRPSLLWSYWFVPRPGSPRDRYRCLQDLPRQLSNPGQSPGDARSRRPRSCSNLSSRLAATVRTYSGRLHHGFNSSAI
jgi:hypothetical protein